MKTNRLTNRLPPICRSSSHLKLVFACLLLLSTIWFYSFYSLDSITDTNVRTWVFVAHDQSPPNWIDMTKRSVTSALKQTSLEPVCIFYGSPSSPFVSWLQEHNVKVIFHTPKWIKNIEKVVNSKIGKSNIQFSPLYGSSISLVATFLRIDLPLLINPEEYGSLVLYSDTDVIFRRMPTFHDFSDNGKVPYYFIMGTEGNPRYFKKHDGNINAGVMLINIPNMRRTYKAFVRWIFNGYNMKRGLHFGGYGPADQGAYNEYYLDKFPIVQWPLFNWKPYWGWNDKACIVHFHGAKPADYESEFRQISGKRSGDFKDIFKWCLEKSKGPDNDCLRWVDEYLQLPI